MKTITKKENPKTVDEFVNEKLKIANEMLSKVDLSLIYQSRQRK